MANCAHCLTPLTSTTAEIEITSRLVNTLTGAEEADEIVHATALVHPGCLTASVRGGSEGLLGPVAK